MMMKKIAEKLDALFRVKESQDYLPVELGELTYRAGVTYRYAGQTFTPAADVFGGQIIMDDLGIIDGAAMVAGEAMPYWIILGRGAADDGVTP